MRFSPTRIALIIFFVLLLIVGVAIGFAYHRPGTINYAATVNQIVCENSYLVLSPNQISTLNCKVVANDWLQVSLHATNAKSAPNLFTTAVWFNSSLPSSNGTTSTLLYTTSSNLTIFSLPIVSAGIITAHVINNESSSILVNGTVEVLRSVQTTFSVPAIVTPYRDVGYGLIGLSAVCLFLLIWNPRKLATRFLGRIQRKKNGTLN